MAAAEIRYDPPRCAPADHAYTQPTIVQTRDGLVRYVKAISICSKCGDRKQWVVG